MYFCQCRILGWQFFFYFSSSKLSFHRLLTSFICGENSALNLIFAFLKIMHHFSLASFPFFSRFPQFYLDGSRRGFLCIYPAWALWRFFKSVGWCLSLVLQSSQSFLQMWLCPLLPPLLGLWFTQDRCFHWMPRVFLLCFFSPSALVWTFLFTFHSVL